METIEVLEKIGLNQKEASVYLALLELGTASVQLIAQKAGIKRPTTYLILDDLQAKGLISEVPQTKKALYTAESPEHLASEVKKKEELLKRFLPNMMALYNVKKEKPQVQLFPGKEGVKKVYDEIFSTYDVLFFSTVRQVFRLFPDMPREIQQKVKARQMKVREILTRTPEDLEYVHAMPQSEHYQSRLASEDLGEFLTDNAIYKNKVAFFSFSPQLFAVTIASREIVGSLKIIYELAWRAAGPI